MAVALKNSIARLGSKLADHKKDATFLVINLDQLVPYARQARTVFQEEPLRELAESIKENGVLEPLLVRPIGGDRYEIIAGERRLRASRIAGLKVVPVLSKSMDDETADKVHLAENIQRENLSTLELAQRIQLDLEACGGDLAVVAAKYGKQKPWVSKMSTIAKGGDVMADLVDAGVTSDRAVLISVASLEKDEPEKAQELSEILKAAPAKANKRNLAEGFMKEQKRQKTATKHQASVAAAAGGDEPAWRSKGSIEREVERAAIFVELSPLSAYSSEFAQLSKKFGKAQLLLSARHPDHACAIVQFGSGAGDCLRTYRADELRLLSVR